MSVEKISESHALHAPRGGVFAARLQEQLAELLETEGIDLAFPIQFRVKSLDSILLKTPRLPKGTEDVRGVSDFVGLRIIALFSRDVQRVTDLLTRVFDVIESEDTSVRLTERVWVPLSALSAASGAFVVADPYTLRIWGLVS